MYEISTVCGFRNEYKAIWYTCYADTYSEAVGMIKSAMDVSLYGLVGIYYQGDLIEWVPCRKLGD